MVGALRAVDAGVGRRCDGSSRGCGPTRGGHALCGHCRRCRLRPSERSVAADARGMSVRRWGFRCRGEWGRRGTSTFTLAREGWESEVAPRAEVMRSVDPPCTGACTDRHPLLAGVGKASVSRSERLCWGGWSSSSNARRLKCRLWLSTGRPECGCPIWAPSLRTCNGRWSPIRRRRAVNGRARITRGAGAARCAPRNRLVARRQRRAPAASRTRSIKFGQPHSVSVESGPCRQGPAASLSASSSMPPAGAPAGTPRPPPSAPPACRGTRRVAVQNVGVQSGPVQGARMSFRKEDAWQAAVAM